MAEKNLTDEEKKLIDKLKKAGFQKNVAKTLVFVAGRDETKSREIENETMLRQPEVSIAMQELREKGWVTKRDIKKEGKGRPVHAYRLDKTMDEIVKEIEDNQNERIDNIKENTQEIKDLVKSLF